MTDRAGRQDARSRAAPPRLRGRGRVRGLVALVCVALMLGVLGAAAGLAPALRAAHSIDELVRVYDAIPVERRVFEQRLPQHIVLSDARGRQFATLYSEDRVPLTRIRDVSPHMVDAVLATEDRSFYQHGAIDVRGTLRALVTGSGGGSGITQQYAKLLRLSAAGEDRAEARRAVSPTLSRKIVELKYAAALERAQSKDRILLGYLNTAYFGNGAYGVGAAARRYFGVSAARLSVAQAAMLAGLLQNPTGYDPVAHPAAARARRAEVLQNMVEAGAISAVHYRALEKAPIRVRILQLPNGCAHSRYPYYCSYVRQTLLDDPAFGATAEQRRQNLQDGGFEVRTALDPGVQDRAQSVLDRDLGRQPIVGATAIVQPGTGRVLAMAQSTAYAHTQFAIPVSGTLQIGSTFKPITMVAALQDGFPRSRTLSGHTPYVPTRGNAPPGGFHNNLNEQFGVIDAATAFKYSVNTWFVRLAEMTGVARIANTAYRMGLTSMRPGTRRIGAGDLSITLGTFETSVVDTANVYATLAASGVHCDALPIVAVRELQSGARMRAPSGRCGRAVSAGAANTVTSMLAATQSAGGTAANVAVPAQTWVGKTGTTTNFGATWFAGYTRDFAGAVWLGNPKGSAYPVRNVRAFGRFYPRVYGSDVAGPLWGQIFRDITRGRPNRAFPAPGPITPSIAALPRVVGQSEPAARTALARAGVRAVATRRARDSGRPRGTVVSQTPAGGGSVPTRVTLEVAP